jgi:hypothetical protein
MIPNMIWSLAGLLPVNIFCYRLTWFCLMLSASAATLFLPRTFFLFPQSGINPSFYKKAGIGYIKKFTQNGELINGILRKKYPAHKIVTHSPLSLQKLYRQTFMFEKFHFLLFFLFPLSTARAPYGHFYGWAFVPALTNGICNVYPVFLQQYIRMRLPRFQKKSEHQ